LNWITTTLFCATLQHSVRNAVVPIPFKGRAFFSLLNTTYERARTWHITSIEHTKTIFAYEYIVQCLMLNLVVRGVTIGLWRVEEVLNGC